MGFTNQIAIGAASAIAVNGRVIAHHATATLSATRYDASATLATVSRTTRQEST